MLRLLSIVNVACCVGLAGCGLPALTLGVTFSRGGSVAASDVNAEARRTQRMAAVAWLALGFALERAAWPAEGSAASTRPAANDEDGGRLDADLDARVQDVQGAEVGRSTRSASVSGSASVSLLEAGPDACVYPELCAWEMRERVDAWNAFAAPAAARLGELDDVEGDTR